MHDKHGNEITIGDVVRVAPGPYRDHTQVGPVIKLTPEAGETCNMNIGRCEASFSRFSDRDVVSVYATVLTCNAKDVEILRTSDDRLLKAGPFAKYASERAALEHQGATS